MVGLRGTGDGDTNEPLLQLRGGHLLLLYARFAWKERGREREKGKGIKEGLLVRASFVLRLCFACLFVCCWPACPSTDEWTNNHSDTFPLKNKGVQIFAALFRLMWVYHQIRNNGGKDEAKRGGESANRHSSAPKKHTRGRGGWYGDFSSVLSCACLPA